MTSEASSHEKPERILVGVDGSPPSKMALAWAGSQAKMTGAPLEVVAAWEYPTSFGWAPMWPSDFDPAALAKTMCEELIDEVIGADSGIEVIINVVEGHPSVVLSGLSRAASLVVVGSRGHGEFVGMLLGSVSEFLASHSHCPVVIVRG